MSSNFQQSIYTDRFLTQWGFHRVQEHPKRSSLLISILILIFLPFTCSLFIIHYLRIYYSLLRIYYSLLHIHYSLLRIYYSFTYLLFISLCTMHYLLCAMHYALLTIYTYSLFYTYLYVFTISRDEIP